MDGPGRLPVALSWIVPVTHSPAGTDGSCRAFLVSPLAGRKALSRSGAVGGHPRCDDLCNGDGERRGPPKHEREAAGKYGGNEVLAFPYAGSLATPLPQGDVAHQARS